MAKHEHRTTDDPTAPAAPLTSSLRKAMQALPRRGKRVLWFMDPWSGKPITADAVSFRVRRLAKAAGVKLTMRLLRRGFGCRYAGKVPAQVLQKLMRHADIETTMAYYANIDAAFEEAVLGPQCNTSRNTPAAAEPAAETSVDASASQDGSSFHPGGLGCPNQWLRS